LSQISAADSAIGKNVFVGAFCTRAILYAKGIALIKSGKTSEGAAVLAKISILRQIKYLLVKTTIKIKFIS
jgi:hypothetical protein